MRVLFAFLFLFSGLAAWGQRYAFIDYGPDDGLPQSQVRCLESTDDGWLWVGTQQGLSRFDGKEFHAVPELGKRQINLLWKDAEGRLFVGYSGGVAIRNGNTFDLYVLRPNGMDAEVRQLAKMGSNRLWIGTASQGFWQLDGDSIVPWTVPQHSHWGLRLDSVETCRGLVSSGAFEIEGQSTYPSLSLAQVFAADKSEVWLQRNAFGDGNSLIERIYKAPDGSTVQGMFRHSDGTLWIATVGSGVIRVPLKIEAIKPEMPRQFDLSNGYVSNDARHFYEDKDGGLWISSRYGVSRFDGEAFLNLTPQNGLPTEQINCVAQDYEGNIWMGTEGKGLLLFAGVDLTTLTTSEGLPSNLVMNVAQDAQGDTWVSTYDAGAIELHNDQPTEERFTVPGGNNRVWCSLLDSKGTMWFGTSNGLWNYAGGEWESFTKADGLHSRVILSLHEDQTGRLWIGSYRGINWLDDTGISSFPHEDTWLWKKIRNIQSDARGDVWCAGSLGLFQISGKNVRHWTDADGLPDVSCTAVMPGSDGRCWISSHEGLAVLENDAIRPIVASGVDEHVNFAVEWERNLWVGTNNGVYHAPLDSIGQPGFAEFHHLGTRDGLGSRETNQNAWWIDGQNRLWVGTTEGVNRLEPFLAERRTASVPKLALSEVRLNLLRTDWEARGVDLDIASGLPVDLRVGHKDNHFTFHYRGFGMRYPKTLEYQYRLDGFDETWRPVTKAEFATYSNLPYSSFNFQVRSRGGSGAWSAPKSFSFSIAPPFWMTWWFYLLEAIAAIALLWFIFDRRRRMVEARLESEKFELKSRMLALEQQNLNASMNRHFVFNALNSIQYYINRKDRISANKYLTAFARLIRKNLDSSASNLTTLRDEIERLELYLQLEHMRFQDKFEYAIHLGDEVDPDHVEVPSMLLQPFLENSIWHGILPKQSPGLVEVFVAYVGEDVSFLIRDNGIGVSTSLAQKSGDDPHVSQGVNITSGRLDVMRKLTRENLQLIGPYEVKADDGAVLGTEVKIIIPRDFGEIYAN